MIMCAYVGTANGKAKKIKVFTPSQAQLDELAALGIDADPDGMAILNFATGADKTIVQIIVSDMTPNLTYSVLLTGCTPEDVLLDPLVTDEDGNGTLHQERAGDISSCDVELFVGTTTPPGIVWSQLQDPDNLPTSYANTSLNNGGNAADNFEFGDVTEITAIRWWGSWCNADPPVGGEFFRIRFYDDNSGEPGAFLSEQEYVIPTSKVSVGEPPVPVCGPPSDEFEFEADLTPTFTAAANTTYWIEIVGKQNDNNAVFNWSNASSDENRAKPDGDGAGAQRNTPTGAWLIPPGTVVADRAFQLIGEVDATELRASGVNPG